MKSFRLPVLLCILIFFTSELNAATLTLSLPRFFIYSDSEHTTGAALIKQEYFVLDDSKWKAAQCSVWLNNTSGQDENAYVGIIDNSKVYWTRLRFNEKLFIGEAANISAGLSDFIKKTIPDHVSFTVWNIQLQPGVNHISIDFGLNNFPNQAESEIDTMTWKLYPVISSTHANSEMNAIFQISPQKEFAFLSLRPSANWEQADTLFRWSATQNFDSAEVSYSFMRTMPSLNSNEISWEAAFEPLETLSQKKLDDIFWKPLKQPTSSPSQAKSSWLLFGILIPFLVIVFFLLKKTKII